MYITRMLITLWGKAGSGKSTVSEILARKLDYKIISIWNMKRELAESMWISIQDFNLLWEKEENKAEFDLKYEEYQRGLNINDKIILDSRLGFYCQPKAFKVLLDVNEEIAAKRIMWDHRSTDVSVNLAEAQETVKERNKADQQRYIDLYGIDVWDEKNYDLVVNTWEKTPEEVVEIIEEKLNNVNIK